MIIYLIKVQILLLFATLVYMLFFNKETNFRFKRYFILASVVLSFILPFIKAPGLLSKEVSQGIVEQLPMVMLPEVLVENTISAETTTSRVLVSWSQLTIYTYVFISILFAFKFLIELRGVLVFIIKKRKYLHKVQGCYIAEISGKVPTFSFFNFLFLNKAHWETEKEREQILTHEIEHVKQRHTLDVLLLEIVCIFCWFNPAIYFFKAQIRAVHEYLADAKVLDETQDIGYAKLLVRSALSSMQLSLANHFHNSLTLKRLSMMKTVKKNISKWKLGMLLPGIAVAVFIVACQDQIMEDMKLAAAGSSIMLDYPPHIAEKITELQQKNPDAKFEYIEGEKSSIQKIIEAQYANKVIMFSEFNEETEKMGLIVAVDGIVEIADELQSDDNIFLIVEETATPVGGIAVFYEFIQKTIQYPAKARSLGIEGRVFIEFVVNTDGSISDVKPIKGIGGGCDEEAVRIVSMSPNWNPGKQRGQAIRQRMVLPIIFGLGGTNSTIPKVEYEVETTHELAAINVVGYGRNQNSSESNVFEHRITNAQNKDGDAYLVVDETATPKGGMVAFYEYVNKTLKYPSNAIENNIEGRVFVEFTVNSDGSISDVHPKMGIGSGCDQEAVRIVSNSPAWNPGKQAGVAVKQRMVLPIIFKLKN